MKMQTLLLGILGGIMGYAFCQIAVFAHNRKKQIRISVREKNIPTTGVGKVCV